MIIRAKLIVHYILITIKNYKYHFFILPVLYNLTNEYP